MLITPLRFLNSNNPYPFTNTPEADELAGPALLFVIIFYCILPVMRKKNIHFT